MNLKVAWKRQHQQKLANSSVDVYVMYYHYNNINNYNNNYLYHQYLPLWKDGWALVSTEWSFKLALVFIPLLSALLGSQSETLPINPCYGPWFSDSWKIMLTRLETDFHFQQVDTSSHQLSNLAASVTWGCSLCPFLSCQQSPNLSWNQGSVCCCGTRTSRHHSTKVTLRRTQHKHGPSWVKRPG